MRCARSVNTGNGKKQSKTVAYEYDSVYNIKVNLCAKNIRIRKTAAAGVWFILLPRSPKTLSFFFFAYFFCFIGVLTAECKSVSKGR